jgi:hypothetical protein
MFWPPDSTVWRRKEGQKEKAWGEITKESAARKCPAGRIIMFMRFVENVYL